jgi:hypothetical protein
MKINNDTKEVIENNEMELTDEELDQVAGGKETDQLSDYMTELVHRTNSLPGGEFNLVNPLLGNK